MTDQFPLKFFHFGMGKCASTYLHGLWALDPNYTLLDANGLRDNCRKLALADGNIDIPIAQSPGLSESEVSSIATSEGFLFSFLNDLENQDKLLRLYEVVPAVIGRSGMTDKALIMVRNPLEWINSVYSQSLKQGGHYTYAEFFDKQKVFLKQSLNLKYMMEQYEAHFPHVVILSSDMLHQAPDEFWSLYEERLECPRISSDVIETMKSYDFAANKSLSAEQIVALYKQNLQTASIEARIDEFTEDELNLPHKLEDVKATIAAYKFYTRRMVELSQGKDLEKLIETISIPEEERLHDRFIDEEMQAYLAEYYIEVLREKEYIPESYIKVYEHSIQTAALR
ncbi:hypothetical protein QGN29_13225 [Temperatibacter marinus]|uniref:Sulfotransferase n=1 Tax=Temperatibacter marinus TaxID=1456591 RepID=A0AA52EHA9_9PROT|nr:hypothetical protein [Temperatibacter marinus]WND02509.1 hypothetical protein QGN29_13225 [Temperatibacter marinus]